MLTSGFLLLEEIDNEALVFLPHLRKAEDGIAAKIRRLVKGSVTYPKIEFEKAVVWCEEKTGKTLAPSQREALKTVFTSRVAIITGGPGIGTTTLVNSIILILRAKKVKCLLCAPTGRAAKRLTETTGLEAKTMLLQRNLIYPGIILAKRLLVVVGQKKTMGLAVRNDRSRKKYSGLLSSLKKISR